MKQLGFILSFYASAIRGYILTIRKDLLETGFAFCMYAFAIGSIFLFCFWHRDGWSQTPNWPLWISIPGFLGCIVFSMMGGMPGWIDED
jgi:hypothetical protein